MLEVLGKIYYIDVDAVIEKCRPVYNKEKEIDKIGDDTDIDDRESKLELNVFKFEIYKSCIERVLSEYQSEDEDDMAVFTNITKSPSFGISFNTLLKNEIIIEDE